MACSNTRGLQQLLGELLTGPKEVTPSNFDFQRKLVAHLSYATLKTLPLLFGHILNTFHRQIHG